MKVRLIVQCFCTFNMIITLIVEKPGVCSSVLHGFETVEVARCTNDNKCPGPEKCCSNGKLRTCQQPGYVFDSSELN